MTEHEQQPAVAHRARTLVSIPAVRSPHAWPVGFASTVRPVLLMPMFADPASLSRQIQHAAPWLANGPLVSQSSVRSTSSDPYSHPTEKLPRAFQLMCS